MKAQPSTEGTSSAGTRSSAVELCSSIANQPTAAAVAPRRQLCPPSHSSYKERGLSFPTSRGSNFPFHYAFRAPL